VKTGEADVMELQHFVSHVGSRKTFQGSNCGISSSSMWHISQEMAYTGKEQAKTHYAYLQYQFSVTHWI
jgi:hypothetical protein